MCGPLPARTPNGVVAAIEEKDNYLARLDLDTVGGAVIAAGNGGQEGAPADKLTEPLQAAAVDRFPRELGETPAGRR
jgi:hypothetical protein